VDQEDDFPGEYQLHVLFVDPADKATTPPFDVDGSLRRSLTAFNEWLASRTGGQRLRVDTCNGDVDVTYVKLEAPYTELAVAEGTSLSPAGPEYVRERLAQVLSPTFNDSRKLYLTYWDGLAFGRCGGAAYPPLLPGHLTALYLDGIFNSTFLTGPASPGDTQLSVYATSALPLPTPPFPAMVGAEDVTVTQVQANSVVLQDALAQTHAQGEVLQASGSTPNCSTNNFSSNGQELNYWEYAGVHESFHPLGIVPPSALDYAQAPVAPGHVAESNPVGVEDLMYSGTAPWGCPTFPAASSAAASPCQLDPDHRNYFGAPGGAIDLAKSAFLSPTPPDAQVPPTW
jgi:hypothetical protein